MLLWWSHFSRTRTEQVKKRFVQSPLARNPLAVLVWRVIKGMVDDDANHLAAGVAYYVLFSLFPLLLGLLAILGIFLSSEETKQNFLVFVSTYLIGSAEFVNNNIDQVVQLRGVLGLGALVGLLWSASALLGAISRVVNRAWGVRKDRPFYLAKPPADCDGPGNGCPVHTIYCRYHCDQCRPSAGEP